MTDLKEKLAEFGCSSEFIAIALGYTQLFTSDMDTEAFVERVEEEHAKVEEAEALKEIAGQALDASSVLAEFTDEEDMD